MKKNILKVFLLSVCGILSLCSCTREVDYPEKIVGNWELTEYTKYSESNFGGTARTFDEDEHGNGTWYTMQLSFDGTKVVCYRNGKVYNSSEYSVVGDELMARDLHVADNSSSNTFIDGDYRITIESMTDNKLVLKQATGYYGYSYISTYKRI